MSSPGAGAPGVFQSYFQKNVMDYFPRRIYFCLLAFFAAGAVSVTASAQTTVNFAGDQAVIPFFGTGVWNAAGLVEKVEPPAAGHPAQFRISGYSLTRQSDNAKINTRVVFYKDGVSIAVVGQNTGSTQLVDLPTTGTLTVRITPEDLGTYFPLHSLEAVAPTFSATFTVPANDTQGVVTYQFYQGATFLREVKTEPGQGPQLIQFTGLATNAKIEMREVSSLLEIGEDPLNPGHYIEVGRTVTDVRTVSSIAPAVVAATAPIPLAPAATLAPVVKTAPTPVPVAPAPVAPVAAPAAASTLVMPSARPLPNASPTATTVATAGDIQVQTNQLSTELQRSDITATTNSNAIIASVNATAVAANTSNNAVIASVNATAAAAHNDSAAVIGALNKISGTLDIVRSSGAATAASVIDISKTAGEIKTLLDERLAPKAADVQAAAASANSSAASSGASAGSSAAAIFGSPPVATSIDDSGTAPDLTIKLPPEFGGSTVDMNPFRSDRFGPAASWFRAAMVWLVLTVLGAWVWSQVADWTRGFSTMKQARGNTVLAGTGAQATALVAAGLITVAVVVGATALMSWSFGEISFSLIRTVSLRNPLVGLAGGALWMLNNLFPVATIVTALVARMSFNMFAAPLFATAAAAVRFVIP